MDRRRLQYAAQGLKSRDDPGLASSFLAPVVAILLDYFHEIRRQAADMLAIFLMLD